MHPLLISLYVNVMFLLLFVTVVGDVIELLLFCWQVTIVVVVVVVVVT